MTTSWHDDDKVREYVDRVGRLEPRQAGEAALAEVLPTGVERVLDLGCGDGRLLALVLDRRPGVTDAVALDHSPAMLELARARFADDDRVVVRDHDLDVPLPALGSFDVVASGFAIHHVSHERKQELFAEIASILRPGAVFANLEVVQCATPEIHAAFHRQIGRSGDDPEDVLAAVEPQLEWMRQAGLVQVDCYWRWRGFALLVGEAPPAG